MGQRIVQFVQEKQGSFRISCTIVRNETKDLQDILNPKVYGGGLQDCIYSAAKLVFCLQEVIKPKSL